MGQVKISRLPAGSVPNREALDGKVAMKDAAIPPALPLGDTLGGLRSLRQAFPDP